MQYKLSKQALEDRTFQEGFHLCYTTMQPENLKVEYESMRKLGNLFETYVKNG